ncbi:CHAT domain-containing protein [Streptomyces sp. NPDC002018]|uniref:CHAT domain-containing protein n=1 Tax=Streptomyces sp. NPDC002018 TaxID=3364629 RepID=UPI0036A620F3
MPQDATIVIRHNPSLHYADAALPPRGGAGGPRARGKEPLDLVVWLRHEGLGRLRIGAYTPSERTPRTGTHHAVLKMTADEALRGAGRLRSIWRDRLVHYQPAAYDTDGYSTDGYATDTGPVGGFPLTDSADLTGLASVTEPLTTDLAEEGFDLFDRLLDGPGPELTAFRAFLTDQLGGDRPLRVSFDSDIYLPWPMLALDPGPGGDPWRAFLGHRHQVEQTGQSYVTPQRPWKRQGPVPVTSLNTDSTLESVGRAPEVRKLLEERSSLTVCTESGPFLEALGGAVLDDDVMYFWCHGHFVANGSPHPHLAVRLSDNRDIDAELVRRHRRHFREGTGRFTPFILLNACHTGQMADAPELEHLGKAFVGLGADGVLGPQIEIPQVFATEYAYAFLELYLTGEHTAGEIARTLVHRFAEEFHNPLALAYSLHCGIDSSLEMAS